MLTFLKAMSRDLCLIHGGRHKPKLTHLVLSEQCHEVEAALGRVLAIHGGRHERIFVHLVLSEQMPRGRGSSCVHGGRKKCQLLTLFCLRSATRSRQLLTASMEVAISLIDSPCSV